MQRTILKSKIHRATITDADLNYERSLTIDPVLIENTDILPYTNLPDEEINHHQPIVVLVDEENKVKSTHVTV